MPVRYVIGEEENDKLGDMNGKGDVKSLCEGMGENFPKGLRNLHVFLVLLLHQAIGNSFMENK